METLSIGEKLVLGVLVIGVIFWLKPGIKAAIEKSRQAKSDWPSLLVPMALVSLFVIFLMMMV
jgi:hypothetical protein